MIFKDYYKILGFDTNKVSLDDIDNVKKLICDPAAYSGAAVTNRRVAWKDIWKWH